MRTTNFILKLSIASVMLALVQLAQAAENDNIVTAPAEPAQVNGMPANHHPAFEGFYANFGVDYTSLSAAFDYAGQIRVNAGSEDVINVPGNTNKSGSAIGGLFKAGYAFRIQPKIYLGVAAFYDMRGNTSLLSDSYYYDLDVGNSVNVSAKAGSSYGILLQPGYILDDQKSAVYLNLGLDMTAIQVTSSLYNANTGTEVQSMSSSKTATGLKIGAGYQRQMTFLKFKGAHNLTWFAELNYMPTSSLDISQSDTGSAKAPALPVTRVEEIKSKLGSTQVVLGVNYYF